jgi:diguanylate cyclase (GGDEF)-like protein
LLVEDSRSQGSEIASALEKRGYAVTWVRKGIEALKLARKEEHDLVVLDVVLGDVDGFSVCRWLRMDPKTSGIPILMLTVKDELRDRVEGLNVGANDYLPKPFETDELEARIYAALRVRASQLELQQRNAQLESMLRNVETLAITDALTGLFNRRRFDDVLRREFAATRRYRHGLCCILVDIDHFKVVNDAHGHDVGDQVLKAMAERLSTNLREVDLVARYGGEEFGVLLPHTPRKNARVVAERMAVAVRTLGVEVGGETISVTASFGVASSEEIDSADAGELVKAADQALYRAKRNGRDRIEVYDPEKDDLPNL